MDDIDTNTDSVVDLSPRPPMRSLTFWMTSSNLVSSVLSMGYWGVEATPAPGINIHHGGIISTRSFIASLINDTCQTHTRPTLGLSRVMELCRGCVHFPTFITDMGGLADLGESQRQLLTQTSELSNVLMNID